MVQGPGADGVDEAGGVGAEAGVGEERAGVGGEEELEGLAGVLAFGLVEGAHGVIAADVGGDAVDGVGREDREATVTQGGDGSGDRVRGRFRSGREGHEFVDQTIQFC